MNAEFYKQQAEAFRDYASKLPDADLLGLFGKWASSKDFSGVDRERIWRIARKLKPTQKRLIKEGSDEFLRLSAVLDFLLEHDLHRLRKLRENEKGQGKA